ncbi:MAG TPA: TetR/AcrR family transcriptional regulator [Kouleothrix sp.]|uniref:TetR/AcrR family transcriptional regulator n=1 Tax=Kouleothrix sp. TaxID=2779161 RepID=UPI002BCC3183|nr:TetR/AcrR family transcriptional regulator [Kouleothrix sp.]HRC76227.1 TetR/AcrR family transcriptional regulator [Kouleothrix sp.]
MSQNSPAEDLRVQRTRKLLREALIDLTTEKGFAALTVQDITERAMVNRATFYRHYEDKYDLAMSTIGEVLADLKLPEDSPPLDEQAHDQPAAALVSLFEHMAAHFKFYRTMLGKDTFPQLEWRIRGHVEELMRQRLAAAGYDQRQTRLPFDLCMSATVSMAIGVIKWWIEQKMPYSPQQMALWLPQLNILGLQYALGDDGAG